jgi:hypothetical protein
MFGKHHTHFLRLCGILKTLKQAIDLLEPAPNSEKSTITDEFADNCDRLVSNLDESSFVIELEIAVQANSILEYFNLNKLALSGYEFYASSSYDSIIDSLVPRPSKQIALNAIKETALNTPKEIVPISLKQTAPHSLNETAPTGYTDKNMENREYKKAILRTFQIPAIKIDCSDLRKQRLSKDIITLAFVQLEKIGLGMIEKSKKKNNKTVFTFVKFNSQSIMSNAEIEKKIEYYGVNFSDYVKKLEEIYNEAEHVDASNSLYAQDLECLYNGYNESEYVSDVEASNSFDFQESEGLCNCFDESENFQQNFSIADSSKSFDNFFQSYYQNGVFLKKFFFQNHPKGANKQIPFRVLGWMI